MKRFPSLLLLSVAVLLLSACRGEEVGRITLSLANTDTTLQVAESAALPLKKGEKIYLWADMDMKYEGEPGILFLVEILKDGKTTGEIKADPMNCNVTMYSSEVTSGSSTARSFEGRLEVIDIGEDGSYTFRAALQSAGNPTLQLNKADLVVRK